MKSYDVIVVGAGFAGTVAAKKCAEAGLSTLLLERGGRAGEKVQSTAAVQRGFLEHIPSWVMGEGSPIEREFYRATQHFFFGEEIVYSASVNSALPFCYSFYAFRFANWASQQAAKSGAEQGRRPIRFIISPRARGSSLEVPLLLNSLDSSAREPKNRARRSMSSSDNWLPP